jgi:hypothetical protein
MVAVLFYDLQIGNQGKYVRLRAIPWWEFSLCPVHYALFHEGISRSNGTSSPFLTSVLDGSEWSVSRPGHFEPRENRSPVAIGEKAARPQDRNRHRRAEKKFTLDEKRTAVVKSQPVSIWISPVIDGRICGSLPWKARNSTIPQVSVAIQQQVNTWHTCLLHVTWQARCGNDKSREVSMVGFHR